MTSTESLVGVLRLIIIAVLLAGMWAVWPKDGPSSRW